MTVAIVQRFRRAVSESGSVAPSREIIWSDYANQAAVQAAAWHRLNPALNSNQGDGDYERWGSSGLTLESVTGPNGITKVLRNNFVNGQNDGGGLTIALGGYQTEVWYEVYRRISTTFTVAGTVSVPPFNQDYKAIFLSLCSAPDASGVLNGRCSLKYGNNGDMSHLYHSINGAPNDTSFFDCGYNINDGNWFRQRYHARLSSAGLGILAVQHWNLTGEEPSPFVQSGFSLSAAYACMTYLLLGANYNQYPITAGPFYIDTERVRVWNGANNPGWGW